MEETSLPMRNVLPGRNSMKDNDLVRQANDYIFALFKDELSKKLVYHNYKHTFDVVKEAKKLAEAYKLSPEDTEMLQLAAWFHDSGYLDTYDGHEGKSADRAEAWLKEHNYPKEQIERVRACIMATRKGAETHTLLEEILVDADLSNIGQETFFATAELLRVEWEIFLNKEFSNTEWAEFQLDFLLSHNFQTEKAQKRYSEQLSLNIQEQRKHLKKAEKKKDKKKKKKDKKKGKDGEDFAEPKRGIETMFRNIYSTHTTLSGMADNKANMMISVNAIILSIIITYTGAKTATKGEELFENLKLLIPVGILILTNVVSIVFAIISAQPEVTSLLKRSNKDMPNPERKINLLFFGNFTKLSLTDFEKGMHGIMREKNTLYDNMIMDIYYLGEVLERKYRLLRTSYTVFMLGLILTVLAFIAVFFYTKFNPGSLFIEQR
jgi:predicted metal-dependent HD superfamily phosphohydrolase